MALPSKANKVTNNVNNAIIRHYLALFCVCVIVAVACWLCPCRRRRRTFRQIVDLLSSSSDFPGAPSIVLVQVVYSGPTKPKISFTNSRTERFVGCCYTWRGTPVGPLLTERMKRKKNNTRLEKEGRLAAQRFSYGANFFYNFYFYIPSRGFVEEWQTVSMALGSRVALGLGNNGSHCTHVTSKRKGELRIETTRK